MNRINSDHCSKLILRGVHSPLTPSLHRSLVTKATRLLRHAPDILRLRIDVVYTNVGRAPIFTAKGKVELAGPDLAASVATDRADVSANLLIAKLDRMLRKRATHRMRSRGSDDIRTFHASASA